MTKEQFEQLKPGDPIIPMTDFEPHVYIVERIDGDYIYTNTGHEYDYSDVEIVE